MTEFDVYVGQEYQIYGQSVFKGKVSYLIDPRNDSTPSWYPAELFEIVDGRTPNNWHFQFFPEGSIDSLGAIWGYFELVYNPDHYDELFDRAPDALFIFAKHKLSLID